MLCLEKRRFSSRNQLLESIPVEGEEPHAEAAEFLNETAADYMRMACTQAQKTQPAEPHILENLSRKILVMGGGIAGLTAAKEAAAAGYEVTLVEKEDKLGGKASDWRKSFPTKSPWTDLEDNPVAALIAEVESDSKITVRTGAEVARIAGAAHGLFGDGHIQDQHLVLVMLVQCAGVRARRGKGIRSRYCIARLDVFNGCGDFL